MTVKEIAVAGPEKPITSIRTFVISDGRDSETVISITHLTNHGLFDEAPQFKDNGDTPTNQALINLLALLGGELIKAPYAAALIQS
jgi:hypothetical protein